MICLYLGRSGSIQQIRTNIIKVGSESWLLTCSSDITLSPSSCNVSTLYCKENKKFVTTILVCFIFGPSVNFMSQMVDNSELQIDLANVNAAIVH